ncbi:MAG: hypothetical protein RLZZ176_3236 [Cyanobacteriota bacterium]
MKVAVNGQAKTLNSDELRLLFDKSLTNPRDRTLFAICLFTGCRVSEALRHCLLFVFLLVVGCRKLSDFRRLISKAKL